MTHEAHALDEQQYAVHNLKEIIQILTDLAKQETMLKASFNQGKDVCFTSVIAVDTKNHAVYLDIGMDEVFNSRLLASHHVEFSKEGGIRITWISSHLSVVTLKDGKAIKVALPHNLIRVQRREFYRQPTPQIIPVPCSIPIPDANNPEVEKALELTLVNTSVGGVGATAPDPLDPALVVGACFDSCRISFPEVGTTSLRIRIQHIYPITMKDGTIKHRIGLQYIEPSRGNQALIQRYTFNLEREAMAIATSPS